MKILASTRKLDNKAKENVRGKVEMRALTSEEKDTLPAELKKQAEEEGWEGLNVLLEDANPDGRVVKVNYYWRLEGGRWVQCLHDLLWVGPRKEGTINNTASIFGQIE